jgi:hypothetical protein
MGQNLNHYIVTMDGKGGNSKKYTDNIKLFLTEEINQQHRNGILLMFNVHCDIIYVFKQLSV